MFFSKCMDEKTTKDMYRRLSKLIHPDRGGDSQLMSLLNEGYEKRMSMFEKNQQKEECPFQSDDKVYQNEFLEEILDGIYAYSRINPKFDLSFTTKMSNFLEKNGYLTAKQYKALLNIYEKFNIKENISE